MAPITPDTVTWRFDINYEGNSGQHQMRVRVRPDFTENQAVTSALLARDLMAPVLHDDVVLTTVERYAPGETFSIPLVVAPLQGVVTGGIGPELFPRFISMVGRSLTGRRVRYYLYETPVAVDADYRVPVGVAVELDALRAHLDNPATGICAIDGSDIRIAPYYNTGYNAYYQRKRRQVS